MNWTRVAATVGLACVDRGLPKRMRATTASAARAPGLADVARGA